MVLATENEIRKALPLLDLKWAIQNDKQDFDTNFIYYCKDMGTVIKLAIDNEVDINYAIHRWFNFSTSKTVENIFYSLGAEHFEDPTDHDIDIIIEGIPYDVKLSIISPKYQGDKDLTRISNKNAYMQWLEANASTESREHHANKIYVICENQEGKCNFTEITQKVSAFMNYFKQNLPKNKSEYNCQLVYVADKSLNN